MSAPATTKRKTQAPPREPSQPLGDGERAGFPPKPKSKRASASHSPTTPTTPAGTRQTAPTKEGESSTVKLSSKQAAPKRYSVHSSAHWIPYFATDDGPQLIVYLRLYLSGYTSPSTPLALLHQAGHASPHFYECWRGTHTKHTG